MVGRNNVDEKDPTGKVVGREILAVARNPGFGWVDYHFQNPKTGQVEPKSVYVEFVEGIVLGCGIYRNRGPAQPGVQLLAADGVPSWSRLGRA